MTTGQFSQALATHCAIHERIVTPLVARVTPLALAVCQIVAAYAQPSDAEFAARAFAGAHSYTFTTGAWRIGYSEGGVLSITYTSEGGHEHIRVIVQRLADLDDLNILMRGYVESENDGIDTLTLRRILALAARAAELLESRLRIDAAGPLTIV
jgi:hypothetical protein